MSLGEVAEEGLGVGVGVGGRGPCGQCGDQSSLFAVGDTSESSAPHAHTVPSFVY